MTNEVSEWVAYTANIYIKVAKVFAGTLVDGKIYKQVQKWIKNGSTHEKINSLHAADQQFYLFIASQGL